MNKMKVTVNDLPELPFELILSYLSLEDRIKARAVSRSWCSLINIFKVKNLCFSTRPRGFIYQNGRWVNGTFAQNFICSPGFERFFCTFGQSILSNLKKLRLCDLRLNKNEVAALAQAINSFGRLEELDIFEFDLKVRSEPKPDFELNLPMLTSIRFQEAHAIAKLTLEAPKLRKATIWCFRSLKVHLIHAESVERLLIGQWVKGIEVKKMKNLKYLYIAPYQTFDSTLLANLEQLKEIHLSDDRDLVGKLFEQKERYGCTSLRIFLCGVLLNGPKDPVLVHPVHQDLAYLVEDSSKLAEEIPFLTFIAYPPRHDDVPIDHEINVLKKFTDLSQFFDRQPIPDIERFLAILKNLDNIAILQFGCNQPQNLFDRLPDHCPTVQRLEICELSDFGFIFKLKNLNYLEIGSPIGVELIRMIMGELPFLSEFRFKYLNKREIIKVENAKRFQIWVDGEFKNVLNLDAAIQFIVKRSQR